MTTSTFWMLLQNKINEDHMVALMNSFVLFYFSFHIYLLFSFNFSLILIHLISENDDAMIDLFCLQKKIMGIILSRRFLLNIQKIVLTEIDSYDLNLLPLFCFIESSVVEISQNFFPCVNNDSKKI